MRENEMTILKQLLVSAASAALLAACSGPASAPPA
ncbi:MAG: putative lipoprotein YajG, partial [Maricaulis sp.]